MSRIGHNIASFLRSIFSFFLDVEKEERIKVILLTVSFFFVIGAYTVVKELKDSIFASVVGEDYQPKAKMIVIFLLIPAIFFYSKLVDVLKRHNLLYFYTILYSIIGFVFVYLMAHPTIGLANTVASPNRYFGWLFYFFIESYSPFVVSVFWAFANSVTSPTSVRQNYSIMISGSKLGGMLSAMFAWWILRSKCADGCMRFSDVTNHQILLGYSSVFLLIVPALVYLLIKYVPQKNLHGYEAGHEAEVELDKPENRESTFRGMISGFMLLIKNPYVLGIFSIGFFYELINQVFSYERLVIGKKITTNASEFSAYLFEQIFWVHAIGFVISLFGTRAIISYFGERKSLLVVPILIGITLLYFVFYPSDGILYVFVLSRSLNYALTQPLRESLYIPTIRDVQFKSKSWIDGFGTKFAKTCGATFNDFVKNLSYSAHTFANSILFMMTAMLWILSSYWLGWRFEKAVKNNEVIGKEEVLGEDN